MSRLKTASTIFAAVFVQAMPFLALGVVISGLIAAFVSPEWLARHLPAEKVPRFWPQASAALR